MYDLNDTTTLKVTTAKFYLPSGRLIQKEDYLGNGFLTDGLNEKDSLFITQGGREVSGGGGIIPDIMTMPNKYSSFVNSLWKEKAFLTFASDYVPKNPNLKEKFDKKFEISNNILKDFRKFINDYNLEFFIKGEKEKEKIINYLKNQSISINSISGNISYNSNIDEVKSVLIEIAKNNENVLGTPEPRVRFREFADHGLRLQLLFWIHKPEIRGRTIDAVNTEIYKQFAQQKISIPYPTMEVLLPDK